MASPRARSRAGAHAVPSSRVRARGEAIDCSACAHSPSQTGVDALAAHPTDLPAPHFSLCLCFAFPFCYSLLPSRHSLFPICHPEGWAERRQAPGVSGHPRPAMTLQARHPAGCLPPSAEGGAPLGAPPWRFWAGGRASFSGISSGSVQRAPRSQVVVPGGRDPGPPECQRLRAAAAGRHSPLHLHERR